MGCDSARYEYAGLRIGGVVIDLHLGADREGLQGLCCFLFGEIARSHRFQAAAGVRRTIDDVLVAELDIPVVIGNGDLAFTDVMGAWAGLCDVSVNIRPGLAGLTIPPGVPSQRAEKQHEADQQNFSQIAAHEAGLSREDTPPGIDLSWKVVTVMASSSPFYAHLSRLRFIKRWGLMRNAVEEDVAQHSWEVAILAHALAVIRRDVLGLPCDPNSVATRALFHDATEAITGDLPTPVKYSPAMRHASANLENEVSGEMLALLPAAVRPAIERALDHRQWPEDEARLIKTADRLAAWLKCQAELRYGNREFEQAAQQIHAKLEETMTPELRYFLDQFGAAYDLTLDSLMRSAD